MKTITKISLGIAFAVAGGVEGQSILANKRWDDNMAQLIRPVNEAMEILVLPDNLDDEDRTKVLLSDKNSGAVIAAYYLHSSADAMTAPFKYAPYAVRKDTHGADEGFLRDKQTIRQIYTLACDALKAYTELPAVWWMKESQQRILSLTTQEVQTARKLHCQ